MLKILQVIPNKGWAIDKLMLLISGDIRRHYLDADGTTISIKDVDVIDWGLWCSLPKFRIERPSVLTVYHLTKEAEKDAQERIKIAQPTIVIASCKAVKKTLKRLGIKSRIIALPTIQQPFRVGYIGRDVPEKRFEIIDEACRETNVVCCGLRRKGPEFELLEQELMAWYRSLNVFVVATNIDGEALTRIEALSVGTPVISTKIGKGIYKKGITWFDGSVKDLVKKINKMKPEIPQTPESYSREYIKAYNEAFESFTSNS
jgi:glycosyltransferase involved in cell wall biosynthesis